MTSSQVALFNTYRSLLTASLTENNSSRYISMINDAIYRRQVNIYIYIYIALFVEVTQNAIYLNEQLLCGQIRANSEIDLKRGFLVIHLSLSITFITFLNYLGLKDTLYKVN